MELGIESLKTNVSNLLIDVALLSAKIDANHKSLRESLDSISKLTERHNSTLYGNGSPGLTGRFRAVEDLNKTFKDHEDNDKRVYLAIFGLLVTILLGISKLAFFN